MSFPDRLQHRLENYLGEDLRLICRKKLLSGVIFDVLTFRIYNHLFNCDIGFYINNRCNLCAKFFSRDTKISAFLDKSVRFDRSLLPVDFHAEFLGDKILFSVHYLSVVSKHYDDSYCDFEGVYFEKIDSCFLLYKKYLEILCCVVFNSLLKEILPLVLSAFDDNNKQGLDHERTKLVSIFFRETIIFSLPDAIIN